MGTLQDLLKEVPLSAVLKERVALSEEKYRTALEQVAQLKTRVAQLEDENRRLLKSAKSDTAPTVSADTAKVLVALFKAADIGDRDVGALARKMQMERGVLQYHLDRLDELSFAVCGGGNYVSGEIYWALTPDGRKFAVERGLI